MRKAVINSFLIVIIAFVFPSCKFVNNINAPVPAATYKNVRYVANMISSSVWANPKISYQSANGLITQTQGMNLDITLQLNVGTSAVLNASCIGSYNPLQLNSSAAISLKMYVNDSLKAQANDFRTDSLASVAASAACSYLIK